jgi:hypothetical protein
MEEVSIQELRGQRLLARVERMKSLGLDPDKILSLDQRVYLRDTLIRKERATKSFTEQMKALENK